MDKKASFDDWIVAKLAFISAQGLYSAAEHAHSFSIRGVLVFLKRLRKLRQITDIISFLEIAVRICGN